jgi:Ni2+-binding GTPase involved in maturation of urease and hydrogenase
MGVPVSQLLTGGACHLEAKLVHHALRDLPLGEIDLVIVKGRDTVSGADEQPKSHQDPLDHI